MLKPMTLGWALLSLVPSLALAGENPYTASVEPQHKIAQRSSDIVARVARQALPAVVSITIGETIGSGFVVSPDGFIATAAHVVKEISEEKAAVEMTSSGDGDSYEIASTREATPILVDFLAESGELETLPARLIGTDPVTDLAVLKVDSGHRLPVVKLGSAASLEVGDPLVVIGNPQGLSHSVSSGVVSHKARDLTLREGIKLDCDLIQTDAPFNGGSSGGPAFNLKGEVVAMASSVFPEADRLNFLVPVDYLSTALPALMARGRVERSGIPAAFQDLSAREAYDLGIQPRAGARVSALLDNRESGLQVDDVILDADGVPVRNARKLRWRMRLMKPGQSLKLTVLRAGERQAITVRAQREP